MTQRDTLLACCISLRAVRSTRKKIRYWSIVPSRRRLRNPLTWIRNLDVPIYSGTGDDAVKVIGELFPDRKTIGVSSNAILTGGGSFHCITQQEPV